MKRWLNLFGGDRRIPNLLVIGTQKGGTSTLHECLSGHPEVFMTAVKELHHFYNQDHDQDWLRGHFQDAKALQARWRGESTPYYLFHPQVPARVARELPGLRCIALLRDPAERAWSHYKMMRRLGLEDAATFEEALELESARLAGDEAKLVADPAHWSGAHMRHSYLARGFYHPQLCHWLRFVPANNLLVIRSEIFFNDPVCALESVAAFLGVENRFDPPREAVNTGEPGDLDRGLRATLDAGFAEDQRMLDQLVRSLPHHCW